eukprot:365011-Chlamydomonas_euryale.AAC.25
MLKLHDTYTITLAFACQAARRSAACLARAAAACAASRLAMSAADSSPGCVQGPAGSSSWAEMGAVPGVESVGVLFDAPAKGGRPMFPTAGAGDAALPGSGLLKLHPRDGSGDGVVP